MEAFSGGREFEAALSKRRKVRSHQNHYDFPHYRSGQFPFAQVRQFAIHGRQHFSFRHSARPRRQRRQHVPRRGRLFKMTEQTFRERIVQGGRRVRCSRHLVRRFSFGHAVQETFQVLVPAMRCSHQSDDDVQRDYRNDSNGN